MRGDGRVWVRRRLLAALTRIEDSPATTLFLLAVVCYGAYWRVDVFIVDTLAVANALANLGDGHLHLAAVYFGPPDATTPGVHVADGRLYGRNYGMVAAALPILYLLRVASLVAAPGLLLAGLWSGCLAWLADRLATTFDRGWIATAGLAAGTITFLLAVATGTALDPRLVALQFVTLLAAGGLAVTIYLLVGLVYDRRAGVAAGATTLLLGPVGFWATIPKRHVVTAALVVATAYLFARGKRTERPRDRALAYLPVGPVAWVSAPEGALLLAALAPVDLATSRRNDPRSLAAVAAALAVSLVPVFVTNALISGNPLLPPRLLSAYHGEATLAAEPTAAQHDPAGGTAATNAGGGDGNVLGAVAEPAAWLSTAADAIGLVVAQFRSGVDALSPSRLYHVFVRSGHIPGVRYAETGGETIELTLLESAPVLAALVAAPVLQLRSRVRLADDGVAASTRATDLFAATFVALFTLAHLPRLPLHSTVTVRYLVPTVPLLLYGVFRTTPVRRVATRRPWRLCRVAAASVLAGSLAWTAAFTMLDPSVGTLMQTHAVVNLASGALVIGWLLVRPDDDRVGTVALGVAAGAMALFLLGTGFEYFAADRRYLLPVGRLAETLIPIDP
jgi:hypothetical protein